MLYEALEPRDAGFAIAALAIEGEGAPALAERAPRGGGPTIQGALEELLSEGVDAAREKLGAYIDALRRSGPGAALATVHPSWLVDALLDEPDETLAAVFFCLPEPALSAVRSGLAKQGRQIPSGVRAEGLRAELVLLDAERWRRRVFPLAGGGGDAALQETAELRWLMSATPEEIEACARECGIRAVARAFSGISKEDLGKLCHGLPPTDSVRLVSVVVELRDRLTPEDLRKQQKLHLKLMRAGGVTSALFPDAGLALVIGALVPGLPDRARWALAYRLPDALGRRVIDLSAAGALLDEETRAEHAKALPGWMKEMAQRGVVRSYKP